MITIKEKVEKKMKGRFITRDAYVIDLTLKEVKKIIDKFEWLKEYEKEYRGIAKELFKNHNKALDDMKRLLSDGGRNGN